MIVTSLPWLQVTSSAVHLVDAATGAPVTQWSPPEARSINVAAASPTQVLLATGGGHLVYLEVTEAGALQEVAHTQLEHEVSCVDISPIGALRLSDITNVHSSVLPQCLVMLI